LGLRYICIYIVTYPGFGNPLFCRLKMITTPDKFAKIRHEPSPETNCSKVAGSATVFDVDLIFIL